MIPQYSETLELRVSTIKAEVVLIPRWHYICNSETVQLSFYFKDHPWDLYLNIWSHFAGGLKIKNKVYQIHTMGLNLPVVVS